MTLFELLLIAIGLSMDAMAVSICQGLSLKKVSLKHGLTVGLYFGAFQALMPVIGYLAGSLFADVIQAFDHWVTFVLLGLIGANMIRESLSPECAVPQATSLTTKKMLALALATSIDALAVGVTFSFLQVNILSAAAFIGAITFLLSFAGVKLGHFAGSRFQSRAELAGGIILILIGLKILLEHLGIMAF